MRKAKNYENRMMKTKNSGGINDVRTYVRTYAHQNNRDTTTALDVTK